MKTNKPHVSQIRIVCLLTVLLIGGCKNELAENFTKIKKPDLLLSSEVRNKTRRRQRQK